MSRTPKTGCQELPKQDPNNTNINNTNFSNTDINSSSSTPTLKLDDEDYIKSVIEIFKWHCPALFKNLDCNFLTTSQKSAIIDLSVHHNFVLDTFIKLCNEINSNEFLRGGGRNGWKPNLDWVLAPNNAINILQGKYYFQKLEGYKTVKPYENNGIVPNAFNNYTQKMYDNDELMAAVKRKEQKRRIEQSGGLKNENNKDYKVR